GVFNVTGPAQPLRFDALLDTIRQVTGSDARFTWADDKFLIERQVAPYSELPFWLPAFPHGPLSLSIERALAAGLTFRPLVETFADTWLWLGEAGADDGRASATRKPPVPAGISAERERQLLAEYAAR